MTYSDFSFLLNKKQLTVFVVKNFEFNILYYEFQVYGLDIIYKDNHANKLLAGWFVTELTEKLNYYHHDLWPDVENELAEELFIEYADYFLYDENNCMVDDLDALLKLRG